jgi:hypothetical protein
VQKNNSGYWENRRNGEVIAYGPKETIPTAEEQKDMLLGGLKLYVNCKIYREDKKC